MQSDSFIDGSTAYRTPYLQDLMQVSDALRFIEIYGAKAADEARLRADQYREQGNQLNFCRWRQISRLIVLLSVEHAVGTVQ